MNSNTASMRVGSGAPGAAKPPQMLCYRPSMAESNLITTLGRLVTNVSLRDTLRDSSLIKTKHTTKPLKGYNDVSRYTWSTIHPESSEMPAARQLNIPQANKMTMKGSSDEQVWRYH